MINILESVLIFTILATIVWAKSIDNLQVLGDFRSIKLKWNYYDRHSNHDAGGPRFKIRYCELNNWQMKSRCKDRIVKATNMTTGNDDKHNDHYHDDPATNDDVIIDLKRTNNEHYEASINSLRVHTNYSVLVQVINDRFGHQNTNDDHDDGDDGDLIKTKSDAILVSTKSFMARTLRCLANISEIQVFTGPYFGGRISVEGTDNPACLINGDRTNPKDSYNFTISHELCKSKTVDNVRIETMVMVNENREILTHNSRRYLVICGFDPDKYTLTASVAVPSFLLKKYSDRIREKPSSLAITNDAVKFDWPVLDKRENPKGRYPVYIERNPLMINKTIRL
ncbi:uncharacterized protein LOC124496208 [Dermatophagoides farinae]|uniref:Uncharacterized protein n=1 Tax=Dermatophagoides farinae TaxID=6954 RepID=A0A922L282_DERFA|nr:uncharacterized protein LOC124496208 isoform X2 [Dermatophagoides farinae]KAH7640210.1 hypothetical protein HUG17_7677 [Dermatophagoides farinae]KAH9502130.1 hypothetical protein DERF_012919 [Dermatophagoides farinae]